ncbi:MAG: hypothetical protein DCE86_17355 [Flavobacteriaceae bacterium]|jgi:hypothetical protein|nr:MAG: hypothetical protein DCE86_17355 [Flavobacteriaceae bacterium]PZQ88869.1 MAG: hypothetical protein DI548_04575 [Flavobacterium johnsoniae]
MRQKYKKNNTKQLTCYFSFIIKFIQKSHSTENQKIITKKEIETVHLKNKKTSRSGGFFCVI